MVRSSSSKKQVKRRKVDLKTNVITNNQLLVELKQKQLEDEERQRKAFKSLKKESNLKSKKQRKILKYIIIVTQMR